MVVILLIFLAAVVILLVARIVRESAPFSIPGVQRVLGSRCLNPPVAFSECPAERRAQSLKPFPDGRTRGLVCLISPRGERIEHTDAKVTWRLLWEPLSEPLSLFATKRIEDLLGSFLGRKGESINLCNFQSTCRGFQGAVQSFHPVVCHCRGQRGRAPSHTILKPAQR